MSRRSWTGGLLCPPGAEKLQRQPTERRDGSGPIHSPQAHRPWLPHRKVPKSRIYMVVDDCPRYRRLVPVKL
ncbi:hypothetical protein LMH87_006086 [Akanthomyces muscarius]|uniref:Uncharacterized protein n=1 Tax=Akanthomyces muscarius TaxID=2231603 RepID=A0A9W8USH7_AKAMU|nr:hypothetical protein LMH87_006086 [Akanthomyces muscarius]KAJ4164410.1 hypothetical protein LMH87_006086 [Akanthomyces muscarius]